MTSLRFVAALRRSLTGTENDLTGPEALDHFEVAKIISKASGRTVMYHLLTEEQMLGRWSAGHVGAGCRLSGHAPLGRPRGPL
jgi:uncharacterized protein YbjT (DUF2867 family)